MPQVPEYEEFKQLREDVTRISEENEFLRSLILARQSLSRRQVLSVLDVSETTLWRLTKSGTLKTTGGDGYDIESVRSYLMAKKIGERAANNRIIGAVYES